MSTGTNMNIRFYSGNQQDAAKVTGTNGDATSSLLAQIAALKERAERDGGAGDQLLDEIRNLEMLIALLEKMKAGGTEIDPSQVKALEGQIQALLGKINASYPVVVGNLEDDARDMRAVSSELGAEEGVDRGAGFSNGSLAEVMSILRELQNSYTKLMKLYQEMAQKQIGMSSDVVKASADATKNSIYKEAEKERMDGLASGLSAGITGLGMAKQMHSSIKFQNGLNGPEGLRTQQANIESHQTAIKGHGRALADGAGGGLGDNVELRQHHLITADRYEQFGRNGETQDLVNVMDSKQVYKYKEGVDLKHSAVLREIEQKYSDHTRDTNMIGLAKDLVNQGVNGLMTGVFKAPIDEERAEFQSAATLGHANVDSLTKGIDTNRQTAQEMVQQANRVMENDMAALASTSRAS